MDRVIKTYSTNQKAEEQRKLLKDRGIESRVMVDPLAERFPDLAHFQGVAITVREVSVNDAAMLLDISPQGLRRAS